MTARPLDLALASGRLRVEVSGASEAPLLVCVPGLSANLRCMDALVERLAGERRRVAAVDLRGRGRSQVTPAGTYGWEAHARDLLEVATRLGAERFDLLGHSMGAFVTLQTAALGGDRVRRAVLVDAAGRPEPASLPPIAASVLRLGTVVPDAAAHVDRARAAGTIVPWTPMWTRYFEYELEPCPGGLTTTTSRAAVEEDAAYIAGHEPTALWPALTMPTLVVRATLPMVPGAGFVLGADDARRLVATAPDARLVEVDAAHYTVIAHPATLAAVERFLS